MPVTGNKQDRSNTDPWHNAKSWLKTDVTAMKIQLWVWSSHLLFQALRPERRAYCNKLTIEVYNNTRRQLTALCLHGKQVYYYHYSLQLLGKVMMMRNNDLGKTQRNVHHRRTHARRLGTETNSSMKKERPQHHVIMSLSSAIRTTGFIRAANLTNSLALSVFSLALGGLIYEISVSNTRIKQQHGSSPCG